jgi:hypothetical protein
MRRRLASPVSLGRVLAVVIVTCVVMLAVNITCTALLFRALCDVIVTQDAVRRETPPSTPTGVAAADAWHDARRTICRV